MSDLNEFLEDKKFESHYSHVVTECEFMNAKLDENQLDLLMHLADKCTDRPWKRGPNWYIVPHDWYEFKTNYPDQEHPICHVHGPSYRAAYDSDLIVALRNNVYKLIGAARNGLRLEVENIKLRGKITEYQKLLDNMAEFMVKFNKEKTYESSDDNK